METRRPTNRRIANVSALVSFAVTLAALGLTGAAIAWLDPGPTGEGPGALLAGLVVVGASALVAILARFIILFLLSKIRPDGV